MEQVDVILGLGFYNNGEKLIEYSGSAYAQAGKDADMYIESLIRQNIERCLKDFDDWWKEHMTEMLAPSAVKVSVEMETQSDDEDKIIFNPNRQLTWDDFKGETDALSRAIAATYSGFSVKYSSLKQGHTIH